MLAQLQKHYDSTYKAVEPDRQGPSFWTASGEGTPNFSRDILQEVALQQTITG